MIVEPFKLTNNDRARIADIIEDYAILRFNEGVSESLRHRMVNEAVTKIEEFLSDRCEQVIDEAPGSS